MGDVPSESTRFQGFYGAYKNAFNSYDRLYWAQVAMLVRSGTRSNTYGWFGQVPRLRKWIGDRLAKRLTSHEYTIVNDDWEDTVEVFNKDVDDDNLGLYRPMFEGLGHAAAELPNDLVFDVMRNAKSVVGYDGKPMFATDHQDVDGGPAVSNYQSGTGPGWYLLDTSKPVKPFIYQERQKPKFDRLSGTDHEYKRGAKLYGVTARAAAGVGLWQTAFMSEAALNETNFKDARAAMRKRKSDQGRSLKIRPDLLVVNSDNESAAEALLLTKTLANGADNPLYKSVRLIVVPELD